MKKKILTGLLLICLLAGGYIAWQVFGPTVNAPVNKYFFVKTGSQYEDVKAALLEQGIISNSFFFDRLARQIKYNRKVKPGRYELRNGMSLFRLLRMLMLMMLQM